MSQHNQLRDAADAELQQMYENRSGVSGTSTNEQMSHLADLLDRWADEAYDDALIHEPRRREVEAAEKILKKQAGQTVEALKEPILQARKQKMRVVQHYLCDKCDAPITDAASGFVIQGNIYVADPQSLGGLIGNNFPEKEQFGIEEVHRTVLCSDCFGMAIRPLALPPNCLAEDAPVEDSWHNRHKRRRRPELSTKHYTA